VCVLVLFALMNERGYFSKKKKKKLSMAGIRTRVKWLMWRPVETINIIFYLAVGPYTTEIWNRYVVELSLPGSQTVHFVGFGHTHTVDALIMPCATLCVRI
jgi:hypothetical protein